MSRGLPIGVLCSLGGLDGSWLEADLALGEAKLWVFHLRDLQTEGLLAIGSLGSGSATGDIFG